MALQFSSLTIPPAKAINAAAGQRTLTTAADGDLVPVTLGQDRVPARVLNILVGADPRKTIIQAVWGHACHSITAIKLNGLDLPAGTTATSYTGSQTTADSTLVAAFAGQAITYTDTLTGYAYSVIELPTVLFTGQLELSAWVQGRRFYDPRKDSTAGGSGAHRLANPSTWEWSDNPALALADWTASTLYGAGELVDWSSVPAAANANDATVGAPPERRRIIGLTLSQAAEVRNIAEALRAYAGCWLVPGANGIRLVPDADSAAVATYTHAAGDIADISPLQLPDRAAAPTVVQVVYTDQTGTERRDANAEAQLPGVGSTLPVRRSVVRLPGIGRYSQARREAIERLNKLTHEGVATTLEVFDIGIRHDKGDIISVTHPIGLAAATMRVVDVDMPAPGRWRLALMRHDPMAYSNVVEAATTGAATDRVINPGPASDVTGASASVTSGIIRIKWAPCPDLVYDSTEIRLLDADWGSYTVAPLYRGKASELPYAVSAAGTYNFYLRHISARQPSANTATVTIVVDAADLGGGGTGGAAQALILTPELVSVPADATGFVASWAGAKTTATVVNADGTDDTAGWTFTKADYGVTSSIAANVVSVNGWSSVPGEIDQYWSDVVFVSRMNGQLVDEKYNRELGFILSEGAPPPVWHTGADDVYLQLGNGTGATYGTNWGIHTVEPHANLDCESGDLCFEARCILDDLPGRPRFLLSLYPEGDTNPIYGLYYNTDGSFRCEIKTGPTTSVRVIGGTPSVGAIAHVAMVRTGNVHRLFVNGLAVGSPETVSYRHANGPRRLVLGASVLFPGYANPYSDFLFGKIGWARITRSARGYTTAGFTPQANPALGYVGQAYVEVTATKTGKVLKKRFNVVPALAAPSGASGITTFLNNDKINVTANADGTVPSSSYSSATVLLSIMRNSVPITSLYAISAAPPSGVTVNTSGGTVSITSMSTAFQEGVMTITATRAGYPTLTFSVMVTKTIPGATLVYTMTPRIELQANSLGQVANYTGATCTMVANLNGVDNSSLWNWSHVVSYGITATRSNNVVTITNILDGTDSGTIMMTGTRQGYASATLVCTVVKVRAPGAAPVPQIPGIAVYDQVVGAGSPMARIRFKSNGLIETKSDGLATGWVAAGRWYSEQSTGIGASYWVRMDSVGLGTVLSGPWNVWTNITADVEFGLGPDSTQTTSTITSAAMLSSAASGQPLVATGFVTLTAARV